MDIDRPATTEDLHALIAAAMTPAPEACTPGAVGLESEHLLVHVDRDGSPRGRATLAEVTALLDDHPTLDPEPPDPSALTGWRAPEGGRFTPEPGAQLEYASPPCTTAAEALSTTARAVGDIAALVDARGIAVASAGLDVWHQPAAVAQQLDCPRYPAMHAALARRSAHGHVMMTATASLQVNLDLGTPTEATSRWTTALLAAPLTTATFACSPVPGAVSGRAVVWQWLDRTRTGIPPAFVAGCSDPAEVLTATALDADVLLFNDGPHAHPGEPGFTLRRWLEDGHPDHGRPTTTDLAYHLTTLFPEVRARGFLELRSVDALPDRWRMVPVVLLCGLLYDERTRDHVQGLLEPLRPRLPELLARAAHLGVADGELCALAVEVWTAAAQGAARLGAGYLDPADIHRTESYLDRFTLRGRCPADELRGRLAVSPAAALDWAREPVGTLTHC